jgi:hypothetical protein
MWGVEFHHGDTEQACNRDSASCLAKWIFEIKGWAIIRFDDSIQAFGAALIVLG